MQSLVELNNDQINLVFGATYEQAYNWAYLLGEDWISWGSGHSYGISDGSGATLVKQFDSWQVYADAPSGGYVQYYIYNTDGGGSS